MTEQVAEAEKAAPEKADVARDVVQPAPGAVTVADAAAAQRILFKFPFRAAKLAVLDIDLVVIFDDGAKIIMPGLGLRMLSPDAPRMIFTDEEVAPARALAAVGEVTLTDQLPQLVTSSSLRQETKPEPPPPQATPPVVQMPSLPAASLTPTPQRRAALDAETDTGSVALSTGRFVRRTNQEDAGSASGGRQEAELPPVPPDRSERPEPGENLRPRITSDGGGDTASLAVSETSLTVTRVAGSDPDGSTVHFSIAGGADAERFTINSQTGSLTLAGARDYEVPDDLGRDGVYEVTVAVVDDEGARDLQRLSVRISDVNETPTIIRFDRSPFNELASVGQSIGQVRATDPDRGDTLRYSLVPGSDGGGAFAIDASTGEVRIARTGVLDADLRPVENIIVRVTDGNGLVAEQLFSVSVGNVNEAPVITSDGGGDLAVFELPENSRLATNVFAVDPEGSQPTFRIDGGADAALFVVNSATGAVSFLSPPDFESASDANGDGVYEVTIVASDGALSDRQTLLIRVADVNERPSGATLSGDRIIDSALPGTLIGVVRGTDPDAGDSLTYSFAPGGNAGSLFSVDAASGELTLAAGAVLDYETAPFHIVTIRVTDAGGLTHDQTFVIRVVDTNDAPIIISDGGGSTATVSLFENEGNATTVVASDADIGTLLTYSIVGGADAARFTIDAITGALRFIASPDFENPDDANGDRIYDVVVQASDGIAVDQQVLQIAIRDANEPPVITSNGGGSVANVTVVENTTAVTTVTASDPDAGNVLAYAIAGGADAALFDIDSVTGELRFLAAPDHENRTDADADGVYEVIVVVADGTLADTQRIRVTVANQNEAPSITSGGGGTSATVAVAENTSAVMTVTSVDPDAA
jgi:Cadherin domain